MARLVVSNGRVGDGPPLAPSGPSPAAPVSGTVPVGLHPCTLPMRFGPSSFGDPLQSLASPPLALFSATMLATTVASPPERWMPPPRRFVDGFPVTVTKPKWAGP